MYYIIFFVDYKVHTKLLFYLGINMKKELVRLEYNKKLKNEWISWIDSFNFDWFITLTYKDNHNRSNSIIKNDIKHLKNRIIKKLYGKRYKNKINSNRDISMFAVIEGDGFLTKKHVHLCVRDIPLSANPKTDECISKVITDIWNNIFGFSNIHVDKYNHQERGLETKLRINYCLKECKGDYSSLIFEYLKVEV